MPLFCSPFLVLLMHTSALAANKDSNSLFNASLRMTWGLLVVLAILLIIYTLVKKRVSLLQGNDKTLIKIVETRHLMPKKTLFLVQVRGQEFLLGAASDSIVLIARIDADSPNSFDNLLKSTTGVKEQS